MLFNNDLLLFYGKVTFLSFFNLGSAQSKRSREPFSGYEWYILINRKASSINGHSIGSPLSDHGHSNLVSYHTLLRVLYNSHNAYLNIHRSSTCEGEYLVYQDTLDCKSSVGGTISSQY